MSIFNKQDNSQENRDPSLITFLRNFLLARFDLKEDQEYEGHTMESVRKGVQFRGANLWILLFAILICSIGLNVNSPAVIIGAMLISPLMGPILGIGVGVAIFDFNLLLTSLKNLAIATVASVLISALYFSLSPITEAQSELLARVSPTIWDVLIATFGGFVGIIALSRSEKGNSIPGVAIATALMPPICTAGYGIATGSWAYFVGAFYLFSINTVFIAISTFLLVRFMGFSKYQFVDDQQERKVQRYIILIAAVLAIPSFYTAYITVEESVFQQRVSRFIDAECRFDGAEIIARRVKQPDETNEHPMIELILVGKSVDQAEIDARKANLSKYGLEGVQLRVMQDMDDSPISPEELAELRKQNELTAGMFSKTQELSIEREARLVKLKSQVASLTLDSLSAESILRESSVLFPEIKEIQFGRLLPLEHTASPQSSSKLGVIYFEGGKLASSEEKKFQQWITTRTKLDSILLVRKNAN